MTEEQALAVAFDCINDSNGGRPGPYELEAASIILRMYQERKATREKEQEPPPASDAYKDYLVKSAKFCDALFDSFSKPKR